MVEKELVFTEKKVYWWRIMMGVGLCLTVIVLLTVGAWAIFWQKEVSPVTKGASSSTEDTPYFGERSTLDNYPPSHYFPKNLSPIFQDTEEETIDDLNGITAKAYAAMDRDNRELLLAKNFTDKLPIASITKVMTAIVSLENAPLDKVLTVSDEATKAGEATMGLIKGERLTVKELLYGVMLPSGNDAAETLAGGVFSAEEWDISRTSFLATMNKKAHEIGMYDTFFVNPTGLDEDTPQKSSFSTALDLLALGNYALENENFAKIAATKSIKLVHKRGFHRTFYLTNILNLSKSYPGIKGIKPGVTDFAGETLLSYADNGGKKIILVLLGSQATKDDAVIIYDYLFDKMGIEIVKS